MVNNLVLVNALLKILRRITVCMIFLKGFICDLISFIKIHHETYYYFCSLANGLTIIYERLCHVNYQTLKDIYIY